MVSDYIDKHGGFLKLSCDEEALAISRDPNFPTTARALLEYSVEKEGYWNSEKFMKNVAKIAKFKYPNDKNTAIFVFDQSSCHHAFADDALNAKAMNV